MSDIGFIGVGNMGAPMVKNLVAAGHSVSAFDLSSSALEQAVAAGAEATVDIGASASGRDLIITMLPAGEHVRSVYLEAGGVLENARPGALLVDCSTVDVESARAVHVKAAAAGFEMVDAPVSGGVGGADAGTLTFMVGGSEAAFSLAEPVLSNMGKTVIHAGDAGSGQAAKVCNNMVLGISMIAVSEAFALADKLGLDRQKLFDISSTASGQCWSLTNYCPVPGPVPASPANREYQAGFTAAMMLKDLRLSQQAAAESGATTELGAEATALYARFCDAGNDSVDFSGIFKLVSGDES